VALAIVPPRSWLAGRSRTRAAAPSRSARRTPPIPAPAPAAPGCAGRWSRTRPFSAVSC
jgi:hypothetical protein